MGEDDHVLTLTRYVRIGYCVHCKGNMDTILIRATGLIHRSK